MRGSPTPSRRSIMPGPSFTLASPSLSRPPAAYLLWSEPHLAAGFRRPVQCIAQMLHGQRLLYRDERCLTVLDRVHQVLDLPPHRVSPVGVLDARRSHVDRLTILLGNHL